MPAARLKKRENAEGLIDTRRAASSSYISPARFSVT